MDAHVKEMAAAVAAVQAEAPTDILLYNGPIDSKGFELIVQHTEERDSDTVTFLLATLGGDAGSAFRIANVLRRRYKKLRLLLSGMCKSAGTLIAVAASELVMTDTSELGPLDVQIRKRDELLQRESGLEMLQGLDHLTNAAIDAFHQTFLHIAAGSGLSSRLCADIAANVVGQLYGNIYSQIDPVRLGSTVRANEIAMRYGEILGAKNLKPDALDTLVVGYPTHDFVIDRSQAEDLFRVVREPTPAEGELASLVQHLQLHPSEEHVLVRLDDLPPGDTHGTPKQPAPATGGKGEATSSGAQPKSANGENVTANARGARGSAPAKAVPEPGSGS
jgi:hypothetical protein